jgi:hypothetical protein
LQSRRLLTGPMRCRDLDNGALEGSDSAYDGHARRVLRTGLADFDDLTHTLNVAWELHLERPHGLDCSAWMTVGQALSANMG